MTRENGKLTMENGKLKNKKILNSQSGQILILVFVALGVVLFTTLFITSGAQVYFQNTLYSSNAEKALALAEAGVDKALNSLNKTGGSYNGESETIFGDGSYSVSITSKDAATKIIQSTGYIPNKATPQTKRMITIQAAKGVGVAFVYGLQIGNGGIEMGNNATFNGSIYSNGNISGGNNSTFTGDVWVAGAAQSTADQQSDCFGSNCQDYIFGEIVSGESRQYVAQSFKPSSDRLLNKVSLKLKKIGSPANATVRIMSDASGQPNKNGVLATGTLSANLVTNQYNFVDVTFNTTPSLNGGSTYWIMIQPPSLDSNNYWMWSNDLGQGYGGGLPKWSADWQSQNWNTITGDLGFKTFMSGGVTSMSLSGGSLVNGNVHANTIAGNMIISKNAYYQTLGSSVTVQGTKYPGSADPPPTVFPVSDANISDWKNQAQAAGVSSGDITRCVSSLGPGKIIGNISLGNNCQVSVQTPIWVTGSLSVGNSTVFVLDSTFGAASGIMIVDGQTNFGNGSNLKGSGTAGSYLMLLSTYDSTQQGEAISFGNSSISGIVYAPKGAIELGSGASFKEITAFRIDLGNNATLTYDSGLVSTVFSSGPSGSYSLVKGTYQVK